MTAESTPEAESSRPVGRLSTEWRQALPAIAGIFVATRLVIVAVAICVEFVLPVARGDAVATSRPVISSLTTWDAVYYLGIAREGYHQEPIHDGYRDWAFFPAYPAVVRAASVITLGDIELAAILVANIAFVGALILLYALSRRYLDHETSVRALVYLAIAPGAVAFAMAYSESLFLLLALGAFLAAERGRFAVMAVLLAMVSLTRLPGLLLVIPLAILIWDRVGTPRVNLLWLLAAPVALFGLMAYQGAVLGDPLAFLTAQQAWDFTAPTVVTGTGPDVATVDPLPLLLVIVLAFHVFLFVYVRPDRIPRAYVAMAAISLVTVAATQRLLSIQRYVAVVWPFDWVLANRRAAWFRATWPAISMGLFAVFAMLHFAGALAP